MSNTNEKSLEELVVYLLEDMDYGEDSKYEMTLMNKFMYAYKKGELAGRATLELFVSIAIEKNTVEDLMKQEELEFTIENYKECLSILLNCRSKIDREENEHVENTYKRMKSDIKSNNNKDEEEDIGKNLN